MEEVQVAPILPLLLRYLDFKPRILLVMELELCSMDLIFEQLEDYFLWRLCCFDFKVLKQVQFEYLISALQLFMYS